jgi:hypothetical protein
MCKKNPNHSKKSETRKVLVIGDSVFKHIDLSKIEQAAGCQSIVHSYSGAKVEQIGNKIKEYCSADDQYSAVILHVATNNLASPEPEEVAAKMDRLIEDLKDHRRLQSQV